jgi:hypothetical protein
VVGPGVVPYSRGNSALAQGAGVKASLTHKRNFQWLPHRITLMVQTRNEMSEGNAETSLCSRTPSMSFSHKPWQKECQLFAHIRRQDISLTAAPHVAYQQTSAFALDSMSCLRKPQSEL